MGAGSNQATQFGWPEPGQGRVGLVPVGQRGGGRLQGDRAGDPSGQGERDQGGGGQHLTGQAGRPAAIRCSESRLRYGAFQPGQQPVRCTGPGHRIPPLSPSSVPANGHGSIN
ncbi:hypothetical protein [Nonomuraea angiospora]